MFRRTAQLVGYFVVAAATTFAGPAWAAPSSESAPKSASQSTAKKKPTKKYSSSAARARRLKLARARAAAAARELKDAQTPRFRTGEAGEQVPDIRAEAAIVYDPATGEILWQQNANDQRSIASITKLMTALVFLEDHPDLTTTVGITRSDLRGASTTYLVPGEKVSLFDLLNITLVGSDNGAARVLARVSPWGSKGFVERMTERAIELGFEATSYADPTGLAADNLSSALDMARLVTMAAADPRLGPIMRKPSYTFATSRRKKVTVDNTNKLLGDLEVEGGKTGFIRKAGYCLATMLRLPQGNPVAVVVLGARSSTLRFWETRHLFNWIAAHADALLGRPVPEPEAAAQR